MVMRRRHSFLLSESFLQTFKTRPSPLTTNPLGELVYRRTYSRVKPDGTSERWPETVARVVNGTYTMQKGWMLNSSGGTNGNAWDDVRAQDSAQEMFTRIFDMKFLPPGRGLWAMGSALTNERGLYAALNNCAFVTTGDIASRPRPSDPFCFLMDASMLGVGVGFDTLGAGKIIVRGAGENQGVFTIPDSREGWVESVRLLIDAHILGHPLPSFDYSVIRPAGAPLRGFGGVASGPQPLKDLHQAVDACFNGSRGSAISIRLIVDIMNLIGRCVVAGNIRRSAELALGPPRDPEYLNLKNYEKHPERGAYGWTSNNSVFGELGMDYEHLSEHIMRNGEPGLIWLSNMQQFSRMKGGVPPDMKDRRAAGGNPCMEQTLESYELCCLVETFPHRHGELKDYLRTLQFAFLYAKTVTLGSTPWQETNAVMHRNRRIGCSVSGIAQFLTRPSGLHSLRQWLNEGYDHLQEVDKRLSSWLGIPQSIKLTSVKPSGTVSLLAGSTPGMHFPESRFYIRRMRLSSSSDLIQPLKAAGYVVEPAVSEPGGTTMVVEIPVDIGAGIRTADGVSMWEQLEVAAFLQEHWADNQVSCTVTFDPVTEGPLIKNALDYFQYRLKSVSFLPRVKLGAYAQMPYEAISEAQFREMQRRISPLKFANEKAKLEEFEQSMPDKFCDNHSCTLH